MNKFGRLEVICGPMFSEKTTELIRRLRREQIAGRSVMAFKHSLDARYETDEIISHNGQKIQSYMVDSFYAIKELANKSDVIGVDEIQFFSEDSISVINELISDGKKLILAGLDLTYRQEPFGIMPILVFKAQKVSWLQAICHKCGSEEGYYTQRLINGEPAPFSGPTVQIGALDSYEARCPECFQKA